MVVTIQETTVKQAFHFLLFILLCGFAWQQNQPVFRFSDTTFEVGALMTRRNITFSDECKTKLKPSKTLDSMAALLKNYPNLKIEIGVHAGKPCLSCTSCSPTQNAADAIRAWLVKKGISDKRLLAKGYGQTSPVLEEGNDAKQKAKAQKLNERVVFKITYNKY